MPQNSNTLKTNKKTKNYKLAKIDGPDIKLFL